jgi:hypothetical protein
MEAGDGINDTIYIIEPHPSGGVPIASHPVGKPDELTYYLNDMLGTTLATVEKGTRRCARSSRMPRMPSSSSF